LLGNLRSLTPSTRSRQLQSQPPSPKNPQTNDGVTYLGLISLLLSLIILLLLLARLDSLRPRRLTRLGTNGPPLLDHIQTRADNSPLMLDGTTSPLLGDLFRDALFVHATVQDGPGDFPGVFALEEEGFGFGGVEAECFRVAADKGAAAAGVDFAAGEIVEFYFHLRG
jgi:hypothetical protein